MSARATPGMIRIALRHPGGSIRLAVPTDVPIDELMPEFLDVAEQPDDASWVLSADGRPAYASERTLAELAVADGDVLVLHENDERLSADAPRSPAAPPPAAPPSDPHGRPLRERTARTLPSRLSHPARWRIAVRALAGGRSPAHAPQVELSSVRGPGMFTRAARLSPLARVREAWRDTRYEHGLEEAILGLRLRRCATIAVISPKGGVGKTTTAALLGSLLAWLRRDRVVAVETNPDWGSLGRRLVPEHPVFIDELLAGPLADGRLSPTQLDAQLGRGPDGLMVAPAPSDPARAETLDEAAYRTLFSRLGELVGTLVLDCGTGLDDPPARAALGCADQLVLVCDDEPDTASIVCEAAEWLRHIAQPHDGRARSLVLVLNNLRRASRIDIAALERAVSFADGLAVIPRHERAAARLHGSRFSWSHAPAGWQTPLRELAALLAADWQRLEIAE